MNLDRAARPSADEYYVTALQIFEYCGAESSDSLRVDALMDKFAPFVKTNKAECSYLKSLLDPDQDNPAITVSMLAKTLHQYSESQKSKSDLDESFNLRTGQAPQDSDSGISTDGFQLVEELQCELREKAHLAAQLRSQLDYTDRQHEEQLAALSAERDSLRTHLNIIREENMSLSHVRRDYEEACERLAAAELALAAARRDLAALRRRDQRAADQRAKLDSERATLQEQLEKSREECHRINEMYAARQSALLEQNEQLRAAHADSAARLHDQDELLHQLAKDKVLLELELKETLNKWNQTQQRLDRSIDISYSEDQMLTALDSLNADSRFSQDVMTTSTQVDVPCYECEKRTAVVPHRGLRKFFWEPLKLLFQLFAVVCFVCAISVLYGLSARAGPRAGPGCARAALPWRWLDAHDLVDLLLSIEYAGDVPM